jgi:hypothetical protein
MGIINILLITLDLLKIVEEIPPVPTLEFSRGNRVKLKYRQKKQMDENS